MNKYEPVIGLEIHVELNTKTKMFCRTPADHFGKAPNSQTCPVCLGLPGALPYINEQALESCMKIGLALNCQVSLNSHFERKNYFYPDLPKGYQISQYRWPLCVNGWVEVADKSGTKRKVRVNRVHQEEDTGKLSHIGGVTAVDFNRSGVPLVEIVTEPDFVDSEQVKNFAQLLPKVCRYLGVSNADMEKGQMRLEANVSVRPEHVEGLPNYRIELKNINSFNFMAAAINYEVRRQSEALDRGERLAHQTRGWNEDKKQTFAQREKEEAHDYRYFPDPDLPELKIEESRIKNLELSLPELPWIKAKKYEEGWGLTSQQAAILTDSMDVAEFFEEVVKIGKKQGVEAKQIANFIINKRVNIGETTPQEIVASLKAKTVDIIGDEEKLTEWVGEVILANQQAVADYKKGKTSAIQVLIGMMMKKSQGKADVEKTRRILEEKLGKE